MRAKYFTLLLSCLTSHLLANEAPVLAISDVKTNTQSLNPQHSRYRIEIKPPIKKELGQLWIINKRTYEMHSVIPFHKDIQSIAWDTVNTNLLHITFCNKNQLSVSIK